MARDPQDNQRKKRLSRRDFVKTAGVGVGAAALIGLVVQQADGQGHSPHWDKQADIVLILEREPQGYPPLSKPPNTAHPSS